MPEVTDEEKWITFIKYVIIIQCFVNNFRLSKNEETLQKKDDEKRILTMKEIKQKVEQVSKQSFMQGWIKAQPNYGNQIILI